MLNVTSTPICDNLVFSDRSSTKVEHDPDDEMQGYPLPTRMPDRVFGLNVTPWMTEYIQAIPHSKRTPFPETDDIVYPFLISEAKHGGKNPGFKSVDLQTAFPIRSCLMLQQRLRELSSIELNPLVWYMPYIGDRWILAACVLHEGKVVSKIETLR